MNHSIWIVIAVFFPILCGAAVLILPVFRERARLIRMTGIALAVTAALAMLVTFGGEKELLLLQFGDNLKIFFRVDALGRLYAVIVSLVWVLAGVFSFEYMKHEQEEKRYFGFYLIVYGVLLALAFSGNLITFYVFYELMTLTSLPLVLHTRTREAPQRE